ncbi:colanic acid biosynthesis glycosyltransferase WcaL [Rhizobium ruizarguesonis]|uniref:Colanic acid biosynthesis glycosyltransferase WcaL n=1 Tax=Rhizobium ruizarguesonis TaxID=2081791 RepID=A0ABY1XC92_9HYPH|nr:glycosyltransferase [Rhizobium ruizarguesonis]TAU27737.1 colanic acid biosynthesis glycosyltransferase WcaL [Rhizobium ruizarguesonis]TAU69554.1 colanic acid biosynthesis glycosyltransferase WcaL [Rhizobium ruizarguesonis]TAU77480.1 colanic acid biosynthesis glycosyltransferase WcaL [Rhizobium ruizarguesonis]TAV16991.1 colanic acid biosynthesis glycosyltransferase WcaL [Rhizobium ruizarguesonis]TAV29497.1 colanic acid biosynthesis glycosyltransferase WcaL [Rhizobium ruizarguesonis]
MNVTYFSLNFPELTQTFVYNEMRGLKNLAVDVNVVALRRPASNVSSLPENYGFSNRIQYVQADKRRLHRIAALIRGGIRLLARGDIRTLWRLATIRDSDIRLPISQKLRIAASLQGSNSLSDVIHCHFGPAGRVVAHLKKLGLINVPMTTVFHGYDITQYTDGRPEIYRELFEQADLLLPISDLWRRRLIDLGAPPEKITTIRLGIDCNAFNYKLRTIPAGQRMRFITIGRMTEKKGHRFAIQAFSQLVSRRPDLDLSLDIVGDGPLFGDMQSLAEASGHSNRIQFHGGLPHQEIKRLLDEAHIFVLPSVTAADGDMEGIPVSIMEAMAMGLPVISTRHSGIPELVSREESGLLVPESDTEALSSAMEQLVTNPTLIQTMGLQGRRIVEEQFNEEKQTRELLLSFKRITEHVGSHRLLDQLASAVQK